MCRPVFLAGCVVAMLSGSAWAQGTTSRVDGTVNDTGGAILPGATVTLTNDATGVTFTTVTNETGSYVFEAVQIGRYTIAIELQGFRKYVSSANQVSIGEPTTINARLELGALTESVEVRASSQIVQTSTSGNLGTTFDQQRIVDFGGTYVPPKST